MQSDHGVQPSYFGFVETRDDAAILIQACLRGSLRFVQRRPILSERSSVAQSGHVFIYEEKESGIRRWTDGQHWSPSRVLGEFLIYGQRSASPHQSHTVEIENQPPLTKHDLEGWYQPLYGPLAKSFHVKPDELVKKTIKVKDTEHFGATWHLVSYYRPMDVLQGQLQTPSIYQRSGLQLSAPSRDSIPDRNPSDGDRAAESSMWSTMRLWDSSLSSDHDAQQAWPILDDAGLYEANVHQDPVSDLVVTDKGAPLWSPNDQLDQSLFAWSTLRS